MNLHSNPNLPGLLNIHFSDETRHDMVVSRAAADDMVAYGMLPEEQAETSLGSFTLTHITPEEFQAAHEFRLHQEPVRTLPKILQIAAY